MKLPSPALALDELVYELDGHLLAELRLVVTEVVTLIIRAGTGARLSVRIEILTPLHVRGEVAGEGDPLNSHAALRAEPAPILDELTSRWGLGPHPRRMWFEMAA